jgi:hypothetical protein
MAGGVAQAVKHLPTKHEALSSNPTTAKNLKKLYLLIPAVQNGYSCISFLAYLLAEKNKLLHWILREAF